MRKLFLGSIKAKLLIAFLLLSLTPVLLVSVFCYRNAGKALEKQGFAQLMTVNHIKKDHIMDYYEERVNDVQILSEDLIISDVLEKLEEGLKNSGMNITQFAKTAEYSAIAEKVDTVLREMEKSMDFYDIFIISHEGDVFFSIAREADFGTNLFTGKYKDTNLARIVKQSLDEGEICFADFEAYAPSNGVPAAFISDIILDENGDKHGVIAAEISIGGINRIMQSKEGMGKTGESYLVGEDLLMRSDSRFEEKTILKKKIDTIASREGLDGKGGSAIIENYRGVAVLSDYDPIEFMNNKWVIISEIDANEAFRPVVALRNVVAVIGLLMLIIVIVVALVVATRLADPIMKLSSSASKVASGDLRQSITVKNKDEIGLLSKNFNVMTKSLGEILAKVQGATIQVTSAANEILSASQQQAANTKEQSAAISETTSAADELAKTALGVSERIGRISQAANNALVGMGKIKDTMQKTGEVVTSLNEKSRKINQITELIDDVADQTNLLAVNASIEAARAGEEGRGFTVVADEIRKLADSTAKSTKDITALIEVIQNEMSNAIISMEESMNGIEEEAAAARETVDQSREITMSANQQVGGAKQIAEAMNNASGAMKEMSAGAMESQTAAKQLTQLAEELKKTTEKFTITEEKGKNGV